MRPGPDQPRRLRSSVAVAILCLLVQSLALVHLVVVKHVRCAEHGDVMHAGDGDPDVVPARGDSAGVRRARAGGDAESHDHCQSLVERRDIRTFQATEITTVCLDVHEVDPAKPAPAIVAIAIYRVAPKVSPPA